jgi:sugar lactone lactonase YvrE
METDCWSGMKILAATTALALAAAGAIADDLHAVMDAGAKVEKVADGFKFVEGPVWHPGGFLLFSDIPANTIYKWKPGAANAEVFRTPSGHSNGLTLDPQGRLVACEHDRRVSRTEKDGSIVTLAEKFDGKRLNSPNDLVVKSDGSIYFTDPPYGLPKGNEGREIGFNGVFRIASDGKLSALAKDFDRPNGLAFSPDEKKLYINDTSAAHIRVFDVNPDGTLAGGRVFVELKEPGKEGAPDGMKVDTLGNVFCTGPGGVWVFAPDGGLLGKIATPEVPANIGWGDSDFKTLYITARTGLYRIRLKNAGIAPGRAR